MKTCTQCKVTKELTEFHKQRKTELRSKCKLCINAQNKEWGIKNKEKVAEYQRNYNRINSEKTQKRRKNYYKEYGKKYAYKINAKTRRRTIAKLQQTPKWLTKEHLLEIEQFYKKALEMSQTGTKYEVDHIIPIMGKEVKGLHVPWNLQILTKSENARKKNKV